MARKYMGDMVESALRAVGITEERVHRYVWNCRCRDRKERANRIHQWAEEQASGVYKSILDARSALESLLGAGGGKTQP